MQPRWRACFNMLLFDQEYDTQIAGNEHRVHAFSPPRCSEFELRARRAVSGHAATDSHAGRRSVPSGVPAVGTTAWREPRSSACSDSSMACFHARNFGPDALANRIHGHALADIEVCRHFHGNRFDGAWLKAGKLLSSTLAHDVGGHARSLSDRASPQLAATTPMQRSSHRSPSKLRATERSVSEGAVELALLSGVVAASHSRTSAMASPHRCRRSASRWEAGPWQTRPVNV